MFTIQSNVFIAHNNRALKNNSVFPLSIYNSRISARLSLYLVSNLHYKSLNAVPAEQWEVVLEDYAALTQVSTTLEMLSAAPRRMVND